MYSRLARTSLGALAALLTICTAATTVHADAKSAAKCSAAIIKAGAGIVQAEAKILQKCRDATLKGKVCDAGKTQASIDKARAKLTSTIVKACQGKDKTCNTEDADGSQPTLAEIGWNIGTCPDFEGAGCTNAITDCDDIPVCLQCIAEASVNQAIDLYYPPNRPASTGDKVLNKCQAAIGKAALGYLGTRSKSLSKCWGTKVKKTANCPADALAKITPAKAKLAPAIAKACPGLDNSTIGLPANCQSVTPEGSGSCGTGVSSTTDIANCVACVTDFKVDCPDRASSVSVGATYPAGCLVVPPTPVPTLTPTPTATPTLTAGVPTPTVTFTPNILCGNGVIDSGEVCDLGSGSPQTTCPNTNFPCNANTCTCDCPALVAFAGDATDPASILDTGWTGISHRAPIISDGTVTIALDCAAVGRPCGVCNVSGPVANTQAGEINSQRCSNDSSIKCTDNTPCSNGGTCQFYFGSTLPLAAGGVGTCVVNQFNGPVSGTANVETGDATTVANLTARVYTGPTDNPCPRCSDAGGINDGVNGGTCDSGPNSGDPCDANGFVPGRPDFGRTSLDCPPDPGTIAATLPIDLSNSTGTVTKTLSTDSPTCGDGSGERCLCETCNNAAGTPCDDNADCVAVGATICGGRRCLGGSNNGGTCVGTNATQCPGGGLCGRAGEPSKPSACGDDTSTVGILDCTDTAPVDQEGECTSGPVTKTCSVASGHGQRACGSDADCGGGAGTCVSSNRACFLTGGLTGKVGTNTLTGVGEADVPVNDVAHPTLAAVFCVGPTSASAVNAVAGLPGPGRVTIRGTAEGLAQ